MANRFFTIRVLKAWGIQAERGIVGGQAILNIIGEDGEGTRRGSIRSRVLLTARLATSTKEWTVRIRDVSASGARLEGADLPRVGSSVQLSRGTFQAFAAVVWRDEVAAGIEFDDPLDEAELMSSLRGLRQPSELQPYRRGGFGRELDPPRLSKGDGWLRSLPGRA